MEVYPSFSLKIWKFASHFLSFYGSFGIIKAEKQNLTTKLLPFGLQNESKWFCTKPITFSTLEKEQTPQGFQPPRMQKNAAFCTFAGRCAVAATQTLKPQSVIRRTESGFHRGLTPLASCAPPPANHMPGTST